MRTYVFILGLALVIIGISTPAFAGADHVKVGKRKVYLEWRMSDHKLKVWVRVKLGDACKQLKADVHFKNRKESTTAHVKGTVTDYKFRDSRKFYADTKVHLINPKHHEQWIVSDVNFKCIN